MTTSFYTSAVGTIQIQKGFDVIANNIANVTTVGYKATAPTFADLIYTNIHRPNTENTDLKVGHGTKLAKTDSIFTQGAVTSTGRNLDYGIKGDGFFAVKTTDGIKYTRAGAFEMSEINGQFYLTAMQGGQVLDSKGQPIMLKTANDVVDIGVYVFPNTDGLIRQPNTFFVPGPNSGLPVALTAGKKNLEHKAIENSSVDMAEQFSSVIQMQRAFQFNSRIVQISDEIMQTANSLRNG